MELNEKHLFYLQGDYGFRVALMFWVSVEECLNILTAICRIL